jgi:hypothetical protein
MFKNCVFSMNCSFLRNTTLFKQIATIYELYMGVTYGLGHFVWAFLTQNKFKIQPQCRREI